MASDRERSSGFSMIEALIVVAIIAVAAAISLPQFGRMREQASVRSAAGEIRHVLMQARSRAAVRARHCGVKFRRDGDDWSFAVYDDGDGDGVRNDDIARGTDPLAIATRHLTAHGGGGRIAFPRIIVTDPDTGRALSPSTPAVQFGSSTICSFSPLGESTAGSVFLTGGSRLAYVVRVYGGSAKIRTLRFNEGSKKWESR